MDLRESPTHTPNRHPWEICRFRFFARVLDKIGERAGGISALDAGAGDGWFASTLIGRLPEGSSIVCFDINYTTEQLVELAATAPEGVTFTASLPEVTFDIVLALDVVEHVDDDSGFLRALIDGHLVENGHLIFSVPAWPMLFSNHDRFLHHHRRYRPAMAHTLLTQAGVRINAAGGLFHWPLIVRAIEVVVEKWKGHKPANNTLAQWRHGVTVTSLVTFALFVDTVISRLAAFAGLELPGLSWWALCQKRP